MTSIAFSDSQLEATTVLFGRDLLLRSTDASGIYVYDLPYPVTASKFRVNSLVIPSTQYHVDSANNKIVFTAPTDGKVTATIESGVYGNVADLLTEVDTAMTAAASSNTYVVSESKGTTAPLGKVKIVQGAGEFTIHAGESSARHLLGLGSVNIDSASSTITAPSHVRLDGADMASVLSSTLSNSKRYAGKRSGSMISVPLMAPNQATFYNVSDGSFTDLESAQTINRLEIELVTSFGLPLVLNGSPPVLSITFATTRKPIF